MPTITLSIATIASLTRTMRASMLEVESQDYMKTAKAKGLGEKEIVWRHQFEKCHDPHCNGIGSGGGYHIDGILYCRTIIFHTGNRKTFCELVQALDYTMVLGLTIFFGIFLVAANFIVDILYGIIDPRIRITD